MKPGPLILMIEDEPLVSGFLSDILKSRNCEVVVFDKIIPALQWLSQHVPHAIFCDITLPDGNGLTLCRWIRTQSALEKTPIIIMTALTEEETAQDALELGLLDYLRKPFNVAQLNGKIDRLLAENGGEGGIRTHGGC